MNILPSAMQSIVWEIEERCGRAIGLRPLPDNVRMALGDCPAIQIEGDDRGPLVNLMIPSGLTPPAHMIAHEILHAKDVVLDGAPILQRRTGSSALVDTAINNDAAHLEIIPQEIGVFPEAEAFWSKDFERGLSEFVDRAKSDSRNSALRNDILRLQLVTSSVLPRWPHADQLQDLIFKLNIANDAVNLRFAHEKARGRRLHILSNFVRFHRLKPENYVALYLTSPPVRLPAHCD